MNTSSKSEEDPKMPKEETNVRGTEKETSPKKTQNVDKLIIYVVISTCVIITALVSFLCYSLVNSKLLILEKFNEQHRSDAERMRLETEGLRRELDISTKEKNMMLSQKFEIQAELKLKDLEYFALRKDKEGLRRELEISTKKKSMMLIQKFEIQAELKLKDLEYFALRKDKAFLEDLVVNLSSTIKATTSNSCSGSNEKVDNNKGEATVTEKPEEGILSGMYNLFWTSLEPELQIIRDELKKETDKFHEANNKRSNNRLKWDHGHKDADNSMHIESYGPSGPVSVSPDKKNEFYRIL